VAHEHALHLGRDRAGLLVDRDDAAGVQGLVFGRRPRFAIVAGRRQNLVLRVLQLQAVRGQLQLAEEDDALVRAEDVVQKRLVEPDRAQRTGAIADDELEDLEPRAAGRPDAAADDFTGDRRRDAGAQFGNGLEGGAILVPNRKAVEQVFDGVQADAFEIGSAARADALEILQRRLKGIYCTTIASPFPTRISLIRAGSSKGSSMLMPAGFSGDLE
jgi:hypothetical protein